MIYLSASALAKMIRHREVSASEVLESHLRRIEAVNDRINALAFPLFAEARAQAAAADAATLRGDELPPLHGVPITIKDEFLVRGAPSTWGLLSRRAHRAESDGPLVARLRAAGGVILGTTNVGQLLITHESDNRVYGRANNPWRLDRTPGGSSGGEAALIAAGGSPLGLGGDLGGSVRIPAHFCGVSSFKPSGGLLTLLDNPPALFPAGQEAVSAQAGPLARHVADLVVAMEILAAPGQDVLDPSVAPVAWRSPDRVDVSRLRVAFYDDDGSFPASPAVRRAVREAAAAIAAQGASVQEWRPPDVSAAMGLYIGLLAARGTGAARRALAGERPHPVLSDLFRAAELPRLLRAALLGALAIAGERRTRAIAERARPLSTEQYLRLVDERARYRQRFAAELRERRIDVLLCPPHALPALRHGASRHLLTAGSYSMVFNLVGFPAGVIAASRVRDGEESDRPHTRDRIERAARDSESGTLGLPIGVQLAALPWHDAEVLAVMNQLEQHFSRLPDFPARPQLE